MTAADQIFLRGECVKVGTLQKECKISDNVGVSHYQLRRIFPSAVKISR